MSRLDIYTLIYFYFVFSSLCINVIIYIYLDLQNTLLSVGLICMKRNINFGRSRVSKRIVI